MPAGLRAIAGLLVLLGAGPCFADDAATWFEEGVRYDLGDRADSAKLAFAAFRRAAEAGMPEAQFNVGVMLDSGRGVDRDIVQAAIWYVRSALHGNHRAAYNLGQLYEAGEGVPRNHDAANAWFTRSTLPAAREHLATRPPATRDAPPLSMPVPEYPRPGSTIEAGSSGIELVWTSMPQPEAVRFYAELRLLDASGSREVFSGFSDVTGCLTVKPDQSGVYAWRVLAVAPRASQYTPSEWQIFRVATSSTAALQ